MPELEEADENTENIDPASIPVVIDASIWKSLMVGLASLERHIADINADTPKDTLAELRNCVLFIQQRAASIRQLIDQKFVIAIQAHGPIEIGDIRYVVGVDRTTRCLDTKVTTEIILEAVGGDLVRFCQMLVAQPYKAASVRAVIPEEAYWSCFETVERRSVEEKPAERLMKIDTRFVKPRG